MAPATPWARSSVPEERCLQSVRAADPAQRTPPGATARAAARVLGAALYSQSYSRAWEATRGAITPPKKRYFQSRRPLPPILAHAQVLVLAGTDRLDRPLTIGQMQGRFQLVLLPQVGGWAGALSVGLGAGAQGPACGASAYLCLPLIPARHLVAPRPVYSLAMLAARFTACMAPWPAGECSQPCPHSMRRHAVPCCAPCYAVLHAGRARCARGRAGPHSRGGCFVPPALPGRRAPTGHPAGGTGPAARAASPCRAAGIAEGRSSLPPAKGQPALGVTAD